VKAIGVFSARVRVEEKQIIAAAGVAGCLAVPVLPASTPLPPGPASPHQATLGGHRDGADNAGPVGVLVDRCANRAVAAVTLHLARIGGIRTIDAGVAATGNRIEIASALEAAGIPRPVTLVGFSEESSVDAAARLGFPVTLLGMLPGSTSTALQDADTADAVIEHRVVLGEASEAIVLLQEGAPVSSARTIVHVVGGAAVATSGMPVDATGLLLAERAARALGAGVIAIELAQTASGLIVWDALPVVDFRGAAPVGEISVAEAIARLAARELAAPVVPGNGQVAVVGEVQRDVALSA
jgi:glutathione synthase/RimK-type ligase-like ATP-grasp enzyme